MGDLSGMPESQLAILPGTSHFVPPGSGDARPRGVAAGDDPAVPRPAAAGMTSTSSRGTRQRLRDGEGVVRAPARRRALFLAARDRGGVGARGAPLAATSWSPSAAGGALQLDVRRATSTRASPTSPRAASSRTSAETYPAGRARRSTATPTATRSASAARSTERRTSRRACSSSRRWPCCRTARPARRAAARRAAAGRATKGTARLLRAGRRRLAARPSSAAPGSRSVESRSSSARSPSGSEATRQMCLNAAYRGRRPCGASRRVPIAVRRA